MRAYLNKANGPASLVPELIYATLHRAAPDALRAWMDGPLFRNAIRDVVRSMVFSLDDGHYSKSAYFSFKLGRSRP